jgi:PAS domain-containing protein
MTEFTNCEIATLREDGEFVISRVKRAGGLTPWLMVSLAARRPTPASVANLANAYARREGTHPPWTAQPLDLVHYEGKLSLIFHDPGAEFLDGLLEDLRRCKIPWESGGEPDFRSLVEGQRISGTGSWSWDLKTGKIIWSREMWRIFGLEPCEEMTFDLFLSTVHPEDRAPVKETVYQAISAHDPFDHEYRIVLPCREVSPDFPNELPS